MSFTAIDLFKHSIKRANHFLLLYDIINDTRFRSSRSDWGNKIQRTYALEQARFNATYRW